MNKCLCNQYQVYFFLYSICFVFYEFPNYDGTHMTKHVLRKTVLKKELKYKEKAPETKGK